MHPSEDQAQMSEGTERRPDPRQWAFAGGYQTHACGCIGPQNGQPKCPCMMQNMKVVNGRWVEVIDHGPVHTTDHVTKAAFEFFKITK